MASEADKIWFRHNIEKLEEQYKGQLIAILDEKVIAQADDLDEISDTIVELKKSGKIMGVPIIVRASKKNSAVVRIPS